MQFKSDLTSLRRTGGLPMPQKIGLSTASTFTGFCAKHDDETFAPIEKCDLQRGDAEQVFLLGYRSVCRELFTKRLQARQAPELGRLSRGSGFVIKGWLRKMLGDYRLAVDAGLEDISAHKSDYDRVLVEKRYDEVFWYWVTLDSAPEFVCSGAFAPENDFEDQELQVYGDYNRELDIICFNLLPAASKGAAVLSWLAKDAFSSEALVRSLNRMCKEAIPHALVRLAFEYIENVFSDPRWWNCLDDWSRESLQRRSASGAGKPRCSGALRDDGCRVVNWKVEEVLSNVPGLS